MGYLIGMDEAGYGPNLGPLVISASVWWVPDVEGKPSPRPSPRGRGGRVNRAGPPDLYKLLSAAVWRGAGQDADAQADGRLAIADSKQLYRPGSGLSALERGVLVVLDLLGHRPRDWCSVWDAMCPASGAQRQPDPWYAAFNRPVPHACDTDACDAAAARLRAALADTGVRCCRLSSRSVFAEEFNALSDEFDSKGAALTRLTLDLLREALDALEPGPVHVVCDKHGGRNRYSPQLQQQVTDCLVEIHGEATAESIYRWGPPETRVEVCFRAGGEEFLPVALASMASKYLRELAMMAFNDFWCARVPQLRPTAGYPLDAWRFKQEIAEQQAALSIDDRQLWRGA